MSKRLIILDRDGVINRLLPNGVASPEQWQPIDGSLEGIAQLCRADCRVVIITNQSGIAKGLFTINALNRIHRKMLDALQPIGGEISAIFFCPHTDDDNCDCRKPKPGLFRELADRLQCDLGEAFAVGDSLRDLQAAQRAGARPALVRTGNGDATAALLQSDQAPPELAAVPVYADLAAFTAELLAREDAPARDADS